MRVNSLEEAKERYGEILHGVWLNERDWCIFIKVPESLSLASPVTGRPISHIYCNKDMAPALALVLADLVKEGLQKELHSYGGCLMVRNVRGRDTLSTHAYALAVDLDPDDNSLGEVPKMSFAVVNVFKRYGFCWGGEFSRPDGMHFSAAWET